MEIFRCHVPEAKKKLLFLLSFNLFYQSYFVYVFVDFEFLLHGVLVIITMQLLI